LIENGWKVLFTRTTDLVQNRLDRFHLLILDDLGYVTKDQAETSVQFELISARYERRSMLVTANQPFGEFGKVFPRSRDDARRTRSSRSSCHNLRDERRELPAS
jgi:DNA replication protein DnaC